MDDRIPTFQAAYQERVLAGDHKGASGVVDEALTAGITAREVYSKIFLPTQFQIGELWHYGKVSIPVEHQATQITFAEMGRIRPMLKRKPSIGKSIAITSVEGDQHALGGRMVADFLYTDGWEVHFLGADTPTSALLQFIEERHPDVVGLSVTLASSIPSVKKVVQAIRKLKQVPKILLGGNGLAHENDPVQAIGGDGFVRRAEEANAVARGLVGLPTSTQSLPEFLKSLGVRIQQLRRERNLSQQEVAGRSGLERAYISAIEHGKHNLTIGAVMKLADALEIAFDELVTNVDTQTQDREMRTAPRKQSAANER